MIICHFNAHACDCRVVAAASSLACLGTFLRRLAASVQLWMRESMKGAKSNTACVRMRKSWQSLTTHNQLVSFLFVRCCQLLSRYSSHSPFLRPASILRIHSQPRPAGAFLPPPPPCSLMSFCSRFPLELSVIVELSRLR